MRMVSDRQVPVTWLLDNVRRRDRWGPVAYGKIEPRWKGIGYARSLQMEAYASVIL